jgi:hypothetical protein
MIFVTHYYDRLSKIIMIIMIIIIVGLLAGFFAEILGKPLLYLISIALILFVYMPIHYRTFDVLATRLFVRSKFKIWTSWQESAHMRVLFCPSLLFHIKADMKKSRYAKEHPEQKIPGKLWDPPKWHPMDEVLELPKEQRLSELLRAAQLIIKNSQ